MPELKPAYRTVLAASAFVSLFVWTSPAAALECPEPHSATSDGVIKEPEREIREVSSLLASGDTENRVREIVSDLRRRYPDLDSAALVNFFIAAYCPVVDAESISDGEKKAKLDRFSSQVYQMVAE